MMWWFIALALLSSCYSYREVGVKEGLINNKNKYRITTEEASIEETTYKTDSVYFVNDSIWIKNDKGVFGSPADAVVLEERRFSILKTALFFIIPAVLLFSLGAAGFAAFY